MSEVGPLFLFCIHLCLIRKEYFPFLDILCFILADRSRSERGSSFYLTYLRVCGGGCLSVSINLF